MNRRTLVLTGITGGLLALIGANARDAGAEAVPGVAAPTGGGGGDWYERSFYLLHEDHHATAGATIGGGADPDETARLVALSKPDVIQMHARGAPGWTTYPSKVGHTAPKLTRDVMRVWERVARRGGYRFSAYYNLGRDGEVMKRRPEWNRRRADGTLFDRALCYNSGVAENYLWPQIAEILTAYRPDAFWFDGSCFTVEACWCDACVARFKKENGASEPPTGPDAPGWDAFKEMQRRIYREFVAQTVRRVKKASPACRVAVNWAYSLMMPEDIPEGVLDHLTGDAANEVDRLSQEAHWYDAQPRPFDLMTTVFVNPGPGKALTPKPHGQMEQEMAVIIANGGRYHAWDNPTGETALVPERNAFLGGTVAPFLRARQPYCLGTGRVPAVSLLVSAAAHYAASRDAGRIFPNRADELLAVTEPLSHAHLDYACVTDGRLARGAVPTDGLVVPYGHALTPELAAALRRFVTERGGTLLLAGGPAMLADAAVADLVGAIPEGAAAAAPRSPAAFTIDGARLNLVAADSPPAVRLARGAEVLLRTDAGAPLVVRHRTGKGTVVTCLAPAFRRRNLRDKSDSGVPPALVALLPRLAFPETARLLTTDAPPHVEIVLRRAAPGDGTPRHVLHLVNRHRGEREEVPRRAGVPHRFIRDIPPAPACRVSLRLPRRPRRVLLAPGGTPLADWKHEHGRLEIAVPGFAIHQMVVLEEDAP